MRQNVAADLQLGYGATRGGQSIGGVITC